MGGGGSTNTIQPSPIQNVQAQILKQLAPFLSDYGKSTLPLQTSLDTQKMTGLNNAMPALTGMLNTAATGSPTSQQQQNLGNTQQQVRKQAAGMGVAPTDPRMGQGFQQAAQSQTMGSMPELQTIMSLFGSGQSAMSPGSTLSMMGAGNPSGSKSVTDPSLMSQVGAGAGAAGSLAMIGYLISALAE